MNVGQNAGGRIAGVTGAILAGGRSSRMGRDKALLPWGDTAAADGVPGDGGGGEGLGATVIGHVAAVLAGLLDEVLLVAHDPSPYDFLGLPVARDREAGLGPLAGLEAALRASSSPWVFAVACDMPFLEPALIRHLAGLSGGSAGSPGHTADTVTGPLAVVPFVSDGRPEPLHGLYSREVLPVVSSLLDQGERRVQALFRAIPVRRVEAAEVRRFADPARVFANLNRPEDYRRAQEQDRLRQR